MKISERAARTYAFAMNRMAAARVTPNNCGGRGSRATATGTQEEESGTVGRSESSIVGVWEER